MFRVAVLALLALALAGCDVSESETDQTVETTQPTTIEATTTEPETTEVSTTKPETPEPDPQPAGSVLLKDRVGDPEDGNYKRYPNRREVDLRAVHLEQRGNDLKITFRTADPPAPGLIDTFDYYEVGDGSGGGLIQVRKREDGSLSADANIGDEPVQQLDRGLIISEPDA